MPQHSSSSPSDSSSQSDPSLSRNSLNAQTPSFVPTLPSPRPDLQLPQSAPGPPPPPPKQSPRILIRSPPHHRCHHHSHHVPVLHHPHNPQYYADNVGFHEPDTVVQQSQKPQVESDHGAPSRTKLTEGVSPKLLNQVVSEDGKKVRCKQPLSESDMEELQSRIVIAENLPEDHCHQNLMKDFFCRWERIGKLKDNAISGFLPSTQIFAVHYPGYPSSKRRAIETLGGTRSILKVRGAQSNKLELRFRPEDPYSHPTYGELRPCSCFLLKICHSKSDTIEGIMKVEEEVPREGEVNLDFEMVARVPEAYHFEGMADYQHVVAIHADATRRKKGNWTEMHEPCLGKVNAIDMDKEDTMILVPPLFAIKDVPESLVLKTPAMFIPKKKQETVHNPCEVDVEPVLAIDFNIKDIPKTVIWEKYIPQGSDEWDFQVAVSKLFDERPIWPKESLVERMLDMSLVFRHGVLRRLLSRIAYYFSSGPFQRFWIKKGYDPRKDCDSRIFQRIDFRVPLSLRSYCNFNDSNKLSYRHTEINTFQVFPHKFQTSLQLFELEDEYIQEEIRKPSEETSCSYESGWFSLRILNCLRQRIMMRFLSVFPTTGAQALLRAASENFEKLRRENKKDCLKVNQGGDQEGNAAMINDYKLEANDAEEDEEDDLAVESGDEALDAYDEFDMVGDDDEISLQSHSYLNMDDVSRTHLQELFGSFPSLDEDSQKMDDGDGSEEEYQIYEQDSDIDSEDDDS